MKKTHALPVVFVTLALAFVAYAASPSPATSPRSSPATSKPTAESTPAESKVSASESTPFPTLRGTPIPLASPTESEGAVPAASPTPAAANQRGTLPNPILYLMSEEAYSAGGKNWIRKRYDVANKSSYPTEMFAAAPGLPPCGLNTNASRTWVDFFDSTGKRLYGFCALSKPEDLGKIWVSFEEGTVPPSYVYIELNDRQTNTKYKSNLADTTL